MHTRWFAWRGVKRRQWFIVATFAESIIGNEGNVIDGGNGRHHDDGTGVLNAMIIEHKVLHVAFTEYIFMEFMLSPWRGEQCIRTKVFSVSRWVRLYSDYGYARNITVCV